MLKREHLPPERPSYTRAFRLPYTHKDGTTDLLHLYFTVGLYNDGRPGEVFIRAGSTGSLARGALDAAAIMMSMLLQYGVPLHEILKKLRRSAYPPSGFTGDPEIPSCSSPLDLLAQYLERFPGGKEPDDSSAP